MVEDMDMGMARDAGDGNIRLTIVASGRHFVYDVKPSAAAAFAGRIAVALAERGTLLSPVTDESGVGTGAGVHHSVHPGLQPMPDKQVQFEKMLANRIEPELAARILHVDIEQVPETGGWLVKDRSPTA